MKTSALFIASLMESLNDPSEVIRKNVFRLLISHPKEVIKYLPRLRKQLILEKDSNLVKLLETVIKFTEESKLPVLKAEYPPSPSSISFLSELYFKNPTKELMSDALEAVEFELQGKPNDPYLRIFKCMALLHLEKTEEALEIATQVIKDFPTFPEAHYTRAKIYELQKKSEQAKNDLAMYNRLMLSGV